MIDTLALLKQVASYDEIAFKQLYNHWYPLLVRYGHSLGADRTLVQDTVQDLFVWIWQNPNRLIHSHQPESYLYLSMRNNLLSKQQQLSRRKELLDQAYLEKPAIDEVFPGKKLDRGYANRRLQDILDLLPVRQKEVLFLRYYEELSFTDISQIMGVTPQVARNYVTKAIKKLQGHAPLLKKVFYTSLAMLPYCW